VTRPPAAGLSARSPGGPPGGGLFVDPAPEAIAAVLDTVRLDILQVYGAMDLTALRARFGLPIWRPIGVATAADLPVAADAADRLLVEAKPPPGATRPGGNAARFDWSLLRGWRAGAVDPGRRASRLTMSPRRSASPGRRRWMCPPAWSARAV
jgi:phosphoribosylanthranilate isomerase